MTKQFEQSAPANDIRDAVRHILASPPRLIQLSTPDPDLAWLAQAGQTETPRLGIIRFMLFTGNHSTAPAAADPADMFTTSNHAWLAASKILDADLKLIEMTASGEKTEPFMNNESLSLAISYGMMQMEPTPDLYVMRGEGAGIDENANLLVNALIDEAARTTPEDPLEIVKKHGCDLMAGMVGLVLAANLARKPIMIDGLAAAAAAFIAHAIHPRLGLQTRLAQPVDPLPLSALTTQATNLTDALINLRARLVKSGQNGVN